MNNERGMTSRGSARRRLEREMNVHNLRRLVAMSRASEKLRFKQSPSHGWRTVPATQGIPIRHHRQQPRPRSILRRRILRQRPLLLPKTKLAPRSSPMVLESQPHRWRPSSRIRSTRHPLSIGQHHPPIRSPPLPRVKARTASPRLRSSRRRRRSLARSISIKSSWGNRARQVPLRQGHRLDPWETKRVALDW